MAVEIVNPEAWDKYMKEVAEFVLAQASENIVKARITDRGALLSSGEVRKTRDGYEVVWNVDYASAIEFGSLPHMPPVDAMKGWLSRKTGLRGKELERASWAVARSIEREGTDPKPFLRPAVEAAKARFGKRVR